MAFICLGKRSYTHKSLTNTLQKLGKICFATVHATRVLHPWPSGWLSCCIAAHGPGFEEIVRNRRLVDGFR